MVSNSEKKQFLQDFLFELTIVGRAIWSDEKLSDSEKVSALKSVNELTHRTLNAGKKTNIDLDALREIVDRNATQSKLLGFELSHAWDRATNQSNS